MLSCTSCWTISATRRSRSVFAALSTATFAAFSQDSVLVPISSITLYTFSAIVVFSIGWKRKACTRDHLLSTADDPIRIGNPHQDVILRTRDYRAIYRLP